MRTTSLSPVVAVAALASMTVACGDDSSATSVADGSTGVSTTASTGALDGSGTADSADSTGSSTGPAEPPYDGEPLPVTPDGTWQWFDIDGMACADGRPSGIGVRSVEGSAGLAIYFKGGGACFNATSCALTEPLMLTGTEAIAANPDGMLDFEDPLNPLLDYDVVYVPYCTGDIHGGARPGASVDGVGDPWDFVGHGNLLAALDRLVPTFPDASRLVVLGTSAGGIGALIGFPSIALGWPEAETFLLDDSGMIFRDQYLAPCLQQHMRQTWSLGDVLPECPGCLGPDGGGMAQYFGYLADTYPDTHFGLVTSNRDRIVRIFYGFGNDDCAPVAGLPDLGEQVLMDAIDDLRAEVLIGRFATYVVDSDVHVWTTTPEFATVESNGVALREWVDDFLAGTAQDVGP